MCSILMLFCSWLQFKIKRKPQRLPSRALHLISHHLVIGMISFAACLASVILQQHKTRNAPWRNTEHQLIKRMVCARHWQIQVHFFEESNAESRQGGEQPHVRNRERRKPTSQQWLHQIEIQPWLPAARKRRCVEALFIIRPTTETLCSDYFWPREAEVVNFVTSFSQLPCSRRLTARHA